jgi:phospholipase A1
VSAVERSSSSLAARLSRLGPLLLVGAPLLGQAPTEPVSAAAGMAITTDAERLACYDRAVGREVADPDPAPEPASEPADPPAATPVSLLDRRWELFPRSKLGTFAMRAYRPVAVMPLVWAADRNQTPSSPAEDHSVLESAGFGHTELQFQISWKTKVWQGVFGDAGDLWLAYTQSSRWQVYNTEQSRPFRETNYEPEVLLVFGTDYEILGWRGHLLSVGLDHESNGRDEPRSRSWNRLTASLGLEREGWTLVLRPWWRLPESEGDDDNPDIEDFRGRAEAQLVRRVGQHEISAQLRHSLRSGERSHGSVELVWAFPLRGNLRGRFQVFHGYGESLIDYNFETTRVGLGLSLIEWY